MKPAELAAKTARKIFESRGNHSEVHLSEGELAAIVEKAVELYDDPQVRGLRQQIEVVDMEQVKLDILARSLKKT